MSFLEQGERESAVHSQPRGDRRPACALMHGEHEARRRAFRLSVGTCTVGEHGLSLSNRVVEGYLSQDGCRRRGGRKETPPLDEQRKARTRRFLVGNGRRILP